MLKATDTGLAAVDTAELACTLRKHPHNKRRVQVAALKVVRHHDALTGLRLATLHDNDLDEFIAERKARNQVSWHDRTQPNFVAASADILKRNRNTSSASLTDHYLSFESEQQRRIDSKLQLLSKSKSDEFLRTLKQLNAGKIRGDKSQVKMVSNQKEEETESGVRTRKKVFRRSLRFQPGFGRCIEDPDLTEMCKTAFASDLRLPMLLAVEFNQMGDTCTMKGFRWKHQKVLPIGTADKSFEEILQILPKRLKLTRSQNSTHPVQQRICFTQLINNRKQYIYSEEDFIPHLSSLLKSRQSFRVGRVISAAGKKPWLLRLKVTLRSKSESECYVITSTRASPIIDSDLARNSVSSDFEITRTNPKAFEPQISGVLQFVKALNKQEKGEGERWCGAIVDLVKDASGKWWMVSVKALAQLPRIVRKPLRRSPSVTDHSPAHTCPGQFCKSRTPCLSKRIPSSMIAGGGQVGGGKASVCIHCFCAYHAQAKAQREEEECGRRPKVLPRNVKVGNKRQNDIDLFSGMPMSGPAVAS